MTEPELQQLCRNVISLAKSTGEYFLTEISKVKSTDVIEKGVHDFVSYVDKTAEEKILSELHQFLPQAGFIAEEGTMTHRGDRYHWIVDPLDGTTNFLHRIPLYSVSIALMDGDDIVLGVINEPNLSECFSAWKDGPSLLNDKPIMVSDQELMKNALLATGFPYYDYGRLPQYIELFTHFATITSGLRRLGSAAVDLAYTACGRFEGFYEYGLRPWDVAAGAFIVQRAGGLVSDFKGSNSYIFGGELLASNGILHPMLLTAIQTYFGK